MKKILTGSFALTALLILSACGWHLRGGFDAGSLKNLHIDSRDLQSGFTKALKYNLKRQGVTLEDNASDAQYSVVILDEISNRRTASVGSSARTAEYLLIEEVHFLVLDNNGQVLLPDTTISAQRAFDFDEEQVVSKANEAELIRKELHQDMVRQLVTRLQHLRAVPASTPSTTNP